MHLVRECIRHLRRLEETGSDSSFAVPRPAPGRSSPRSPRQGRPAPRRWPTSSRATPRRSAGAWRRRRGSSGRRGAEARSLVRRAQVRRSALHLGSHWTLQQNSAGTPRFLYCSDFLYISFSHVLQAPGVDMAEKTNSDARKNAPAASLGSLEVSLCAPFSGGRAAAERRPRLAQRGVLGGAPAHSEHVTE